MKRTLAALGLLLATLFTAAPAHAADQPVCYSVPQLPGECLDQVTYDYLTGVQSDLSNYEAAYFNLEISIGQAHAETDLWRAKYDAAHALAVKRFATILTLRAKVKALQDRI